MNERATSDTPVTMSMGRNESQIETGISRNAFQAVQRASIAPQRSSGNRAPLERNTANAMLIRPTRPAPAIPAARNRGGILSQAVAAQRANAPHMPSE